MNDIVDFIHNDIVELNKNYELGIYSLEFALGHLSTLHNLAVHYKLEVLKEQIYLRILSICNSQMNCNGDISIVPVDIKCKILSH